MDKGYNPYWIVAISLIVLVGFLVCFGFLNRVVGGMSLIIASILMVIIGLREDRKKVDKR